jgi:hypothetical protein
MSWGWRAPPVADAAALDEAAQRYDSRNRGDMALAADGFEQALGPAAARGAIRAANPFLDLADDLMAVAKFGPHAARPRQRLLDADRANELYGVEGKLTFDQSIDERTAAQRWGIAQRELLREDTLARSSTRRWWSDIGWSMLGSLGDPVTLGLGFVPFGRLAPRGGPLAGLAAMESGKSLASRLSAGAAFGAIEGVVAGVVYEAALAPLLIDEGRDRDLGDSLVNVALGGLLGAAGGAVGGALRRIDPDLAEARAAAAVGAVADSRPIDLVGPGAIDDGLDAPVRVSDLALAREALDAAREAGNGDDFAEAWAQARLAEDVLRRRAELVGETGAAYGAADELASEAAALREDLEADLADNAGLREAAEQRYSELLDDLDDADAPGDPVEWDAGVAAREALEAAAAADDPAEAYAQVALADEILTEYDGDIDGDLEGALRAAIDVLRPQLQRRLDAAPDVAQAAQARLQVLREQTFEAPMSPDEIAAAAGRVADRIDLGRAARARLDDLAGDADLDTVEVAVRGGFDAAPETRAIAGKAAKAARLAVERVDAARAARVAMPDRPAPRRGLSTRDERAAWVDGAEIAQTQVDGEFGPADLYGFRIDDEGVALAIEARPGEAARITWTFTEAIRSGRAHYINDPTAPRRVNPSLLADVLQRIVAIMERDARAKRRPAYQFTPATAAHARLYRAMLGRLAAGGDYRIVDAAAADGAGNIYLVHNDAKIDPSSGRIQRANPDAVGAGGGWRLGRRADVDTALADFGRRVDQLGSEYRGRGSDRGGGNLGGEGLRLAGQADARQPQAIRARAQELARAFEVAAACAAKTAGRPVMALGGAAAPALGAGAAGLGEMAAGLAIGAGVAAPIAAGVAIAAGAADRAEAFARGIDTVKGLEEMRAQRAADRAEAVRLAQLKRDDFPAWLDTRPDGERLKLVARHVGIPARYLRDMIMKESAGKPNARAKTSSASGLTQFIDETWDRMLRIYGDRYNLPYRPGTREARDLRFDPAWSKLIGAHYARENAEALQRALRRLPTQGEVYLAHFMGVGAARELIVAAAQGERNAARRFPAAARANRNVFYFRNGTPRSAAEVIERQTQGFSGAPFEMIDGGEE